jgi:hypothetical protein
MRRLVAILVASLLVAACAADGGGIATERPTAASLEPSDPPEAVESPEVLPAAFEPIRLNGSGKKVVKFRIPEDAAAIAQVSYGGKGNFAIWSLAASGDKNDLLVNVIGKYKGTVLFDESAGEHSVAFEVDAVTKWAIIIKPVTSAPTWDPAERTKGTGDSVLVVTPVSSGLVTLDLKHAGSSNFAVHAYSPDGTDLLANEIGKFSGQVLFPDGTYLVTVSADGAWSMTPG